MTQDDFASYTNYRYWPEMLSSGLLNEEMIKAIVDYRETHGGEILGMTRFMRHLDDWPYAHYAYGLLTSDEWEKFLLGLYAHMIHHQSIGTYTAYEQVSVLGEEFREPVADYCVPSQLVVPIMLKWMLVFEDPVQNALWLCKAIPIAWFYRGISVKEVPTRWGKVSFSLESEGGLVSIKVLAPKSAEELRILIPLRGKFKVEGYCNCKLRIVNKDVIEVEPLNETISINLTEIR